MFNDQHVFNGGNAYSIDVMNLGFKKLLIEEG
jgi:hypothetical protein